MEKLSKQAVYTWSWLPRDRVIRAVYKARHVMGTAVMLGQNFRMDIKAIGVATIGGEQVTVAKANVTGERVWRVCNDIRIEGEEPIKYLASYLDPDGLPRAWAVSLVRESAINAAKVHLGQYLKEKVALGEHYLNENDYTLRVEVTDSTWGVAKTEVSEETGPVAVGEGEVAVIKLTGESK